MMPLRVLALVACVMKCSGQAALYTNPVLSMDFPDPSITRAVDGTFFAYATMGNGHHLQVASSPNLVNWTFLGEAMPTPAAWTAGGCFFAPDVQRHGVTYYMYYAASTKKDAGGRCTAFCIGVATSSAPAGPFTDVAPPLVCGEASTALDPMSFDDPISGVSYLYYGSGGVPLMARALDANRTAWAPGSTAVAVLSPDAARPFESLVEGVWLHAHGSSIYLFYSGNQCCGEGANYAVSVARGSTPLGPFLRRGDSDGTGHDTLLAQAGNGSLIAAPGHNCIVTDDAGNDFIVYHGYVGGNRAGPRALHIDLLQWVSPNGTLSDVRAWPQVGPRGAGGGVPSTTPQVVPYIKAQQLPASTTGPAETNAINALTPCVRATLRVPTRGFTSAGVYERTARGRLVRTLWSRRETPAGDLAVAWDGVSDGGSLVHECARGAVVAAAAAMYEIRAIAGNVTYVWEGTVGNNGVWQVGPNVLRSLNGVSDIDIAGSTGVVGMGYGERSRTIGFFDTRSPHNWTWVGHEDYHGAMTQVATDGEVLYALNTGVAVASPSSYFFSPWTWVMAIDLSTQCEHQFAYGTHVCNEGAGQTGVGQVCANDPDGFVPQGGRAWDHCNGAEQFYSSVIDIREDSNVANGTHGGLVYPSAGTGIAVQRGTGTLLAVAHGYLGVIAFFDKRTGAPLGNATVPGGIFVGRCRFSPDGTSLWAVTSIGVVKYTGYPSALVAALTVPLTVVAQPMSIGVDPASGAVLVTCDASQQVFVLDPASGDVVRTIGKAGGYTADTGPTVTADLLGFGAFPYVAGDDAGRTWVSDQFNHRTLILDGTGARVDDVMFISVSYVSATPYGSPTRVFSNFLEFSVDYSLPLGAPGSWTLIRNWGAGADPAYSGHGIAFSGPTTLVVVNGRTFGMLSVTVEDRSSTAVLAELVVPSAKSPGGVRVLRRLGGRYLPANGQIDADGAYNFFVTETHKDGSGSFAVYSAPLVFDAASGAANFTCDFASPARTGCVRLANVSAPYAAQSLAPRESFGGFTLPRTSDGRLVILDASTQRNGGFHLGLLDATGSSWVWQASPWGAWDYLADWQVMQPGNVNVSVGYLTPETVDGRFGANDDSINYAGNKAMVDGNDIVIGFHGVRCFSLRAPRCVCATRVYPYSPIHPR
jgi:arabinan endo-1,5-alpha-L-arabinosidase